MDPNSDECKKCPPGLVCSDGVVVEPKISGSTWDIVDGVYLLRTCPIGYSTYIAAPELHECRECPKGQECKTGNCTSCVDCEKGYYKPTVGPQLCFPCPLVDCPFHMLPMLCDVWH